MEGLAASESSAVTKKMTAFTSGTRKRERRTIEVKLVPDGNKCVTVDAI